MTAIREESRSTPSQPISGGQKSWIDALVISILSITAMANSAYAIIAPFLPFEFERKGVVQRAEKYLAELRDSRDKNEVIIDEVLAGREPAGFTVQFI